MRTVVGRSVAPGPMPTVRPAPVESPQYSRTPVAARTVGSIRTVRPPMPGGQGGWGTPRLRPPRPRPGSPRQPAGDELTAVRLIPINGTAGGNPHGRRPGIGDGLAAHGVKNLLPSGT